MFNIIYPNFLSRFYIYKQCEHCLLLFVLLPILQIFTSSTLGRFHFFLRANFYMCGMCCFISACWLEVGNTSHKIIDFLAEIIPIILNVCIVNEGKKMCLHGVSPLWWNVLCFGRKKLCLDVCPSLISSCWGMLQGSASAFYKHQGLYRYLKAVMGILQLWSTSALFKRKSNLLVDQLVSISLEHYEGENILSK